MRSILRESPDIHWSRRHAKLLMTIGRVERQSVMVTNHGKDRQRWRSIARLLVVLSWLVVAAVPCGMLPQAAQASQTVAIAAPELPHEGCLTPPAPDSSASMSQCCDQVLPLKPDGGDLPEPQQHAALLPAAWAAPLHGGPGVLVFTALYQSPGSRLPPYLVTLRLRI